MDWLIHADGGAGDAFGDVLPLLLAMLDFPSLQQLSSVSRRAVQSVVRRHVLQRSMVQLSAHSLQVHAMLRRMQMRDYLYGVEIRDCWQPPGTVVDLRQLLSGIKGVKISSEPTLDGEVKEQVDALMGTKAARSMHRVDFTRRVRRRMARQESGHSVDSVTLWLHSTPQALQDIDIREVKIDSLQWLTRFNGLRKLCLDASTSETVEEFLRPLSESSSTMSLQELAIELLDAPDCREIGTLINLRRIELRGAPSLRSLDFLSTLVKLKSVTLVEMLATNLTPLTSLSALEELTLDSLGERAAMTIASHETTREPAWPLLEKLNLLFLRAPVAEILRHCPNLVHLHLCETAFTDWSPLTSMHRLETISLKVDSISDWSPLAQLPSLKRLAIDSKFGRTQSKHFGKGWRVLEEVISPPWDDYTPLVDNAASLQRLHLLGWRLRDGCSLETLRNARRLEKLRIAFVPGAVDLSSLSELKQLRRLELWSASVVSIEFLRELKNLTELKMPTPFGASADITDFSPLTRLVNLETLVLSGRREFKDDHVPILSQMPMLKRLDIEGTGVTWAAIEQLKSLYDIESDEEEEAESFMGIP